MKKALILVIIILLLIVISLVYFAWSDNDPVLSNSDIEITNTNIKIIEIPPEEPKEITLLFGGDAMLSRRVYDKTLTAGSMSHAFDNIYDIFSRF